MHVIFLREELLWIDKRLFNWTIKEGCPKKLKEKIQQKLDLLKKEKEDDYGIVRHKGE